MGIDPLRKNCLLNLEQPEELNWLSCNCTVSKNVKELRKKIIETFLKRILVLFKGSFLQNSSDVCSGFPLTWPLAVKDKFLRIISKWHTMTGQSFSHLLCESEAVHKHGIQPKTLHSQSGTLINWTTWTGFSLNELSKI